MSSAPSRAPQSAGAAPANTFVTREYVRWGDVDPAGIMRYDAYLRLYEFAEGELFRSLGIPYSDIVRRFKVDIPRRVMHCEFVSSARLDDELEIRAYIGTVGTTSMHMHFDVYSTTGTPRALGYLVLVCVEPGTPGKRPWPGEFLSVLEPYRRSCG